MLALQQLRQIELVTARGEVGDRVMATVTFLPDENVVAIAPGQAVVADPSDKGVIAITPLEHVVTTPANEDIVAIVADQNIAIVGANQVMNAIEAFQARTSSVLCPVMAQVNRDSLLGQGIVGGSTRLDTSSRMAYQRGDAHCADGADRGRVNACASMHAGVRRPGVVKDHAQLVALTAFARSDRVTHCLLYTSDAADD